MRWGKSTIWGAALVVAVLAATMQVTGASDAVANAIRSGSDRGIHAVDGLLHDDAPQAENRRADARDRDRDHDEDFDRDHDRDVDDARVERGSDQGDARFSWSGRLDSGDKLEIIGVSGDIRAVYTTGDEVVVNAEKRSRNGSIADVRIEVVEHSGGVTLCAVYPGTREGSNACDRKGETRNRGTRSQVSVDFEVQVPEGVKFAGSTVNGDVNARDLRSAVKVSTVNGDVNVDAMGITQATTVNGSIDARVEGPTILGSVEFSTVNGSIELDLPDQVDADIEASWVNGSFSSELPVQVQGKLTHRAHGVLGAGGPRVELKTVNGSIQIR